MYYVSDDFLTAISKKERENNITGTIILNDGTTISITNSNIVSGTLSIDKNCVDGDEIKLGSAYVAQLNISIYTDIDRYKLYNSIIELSYNLKTGIDENGAAIFEAAPLGIYTINEANRVGKQVSIVAYDNMLQLDIPCARINSGVTPFEILKMISDATHVELAQTQEEIDEMCLKDSEGNVVKIGIKNDNDISTYRDLLYYTAQFLGGFATIDRQGKIKINHYHKTEDITIPDSIRSSSSFSDYYFEVTGLTIPVTGNITKEQKEEEIERNVGLLKQQILDADAAYAAAYEQINEEEGIKAEEIRKKGLSADEESEALRLLTIQYNNIRKMLKQSYDQSVQTYQSEIENLMSQKESSDLYVNLMVGNADGFVLNLEENPLLFYGTLETKRALVENMANKIIGLIYTPCNFSVLENPLLELGDMVKCTGYNTPASGAYSVITKTNFKYRKGQSIEAVGKNLKLSGSTVKSKTDRQYSSATSSAEAASIGTVEYRNTNMITINENKTLLANLEISLLKDATPLAHGQAVLNVTKPGRFKITYELNGELHKNYTVNFFSQTGENTMTLFDVLGGATASTTNRFVVYIVSLPYETVREVVKEVITEEVDEKGNIIEIVTEEIVEEIVTEYGEATIEKENLLIALFGSYINDNPDWDGTLTLSDDVYLEHRPLKMIATGEDDVDVTLYDVVGANVEDEVEMFENKNGLMDMEDEVLIEFFDPE